MVIIGLLLIYITIVFGSIFISSILNKKIEKTIAINIALIIFELYIFGIFNLLKQGVYVVVLLNILLGIIAIIKKKRKITELICTPGFMFFTIVFFILMITNFNKALIHWDQFFYRSLNTKVMFYTDTLLTEYGRIYPPASTLLEYFFLKMIGMYVQGIEAFAMQIFGISLLLPIYENVNKNKIVNIVVALIIILLPAVFTNLVFYESSYPDATLGLLLAFMLYTYFTEKDLKTKIISIVVQTIIMVLMKPAGIAISLIMISIFIVYEIIKNKYYKKENINKILNNKNIKIILILILIAIIIFISWKIVAKMYTSKQVNADNSRVGNNPIGYVGNSIITTIFGVYQENNDAADSNRSFITAFYNVKGFTYPVKMSLATSIIIIITTYILYYYKTKNKEIKYQTIAITVGLILYMIFLQLSYLLKFVTFEMLGHNGIDRYFPTYLLGMLCFIVFVIVKNLNEKEYLSKNYIILLITILLITPISSICDVTITSGIANINSIKYVKNAINIADKINDYIEDDSKIISISQTSDTELNNLMLRYYLYPDHEVDVKKYIKEENIESIKEIIQSNEYKYIYIFDTDEELNKVLEEIFGEIDNLENKTLYKIEFENDKTINLIKQECIDEVV